MSALARPIPPFGETVPNSTPGGQMAFDESRWTRVVERIKVYDPAATEELYEYFSRGVRFYLCRQMGLREIDDKVHDIFLIILEAIHTGELRDPSRLTGYIRTVVRRQAAAYVGQIIQDRREYADFDPTVGVIDEAQNPEETAIWRERAKLMRRMLETIPARDREILTRFYVQNETQEQICDDLGLSISQFRLLKSRAKAKFGELSRRRLVKRPLMKLFVRKTAAR